MKMKWAKLAGVEKRGGIDYIEVATNPDQDYMDDRWGYQGNVSKVVVNLENGDFFTLTPVLSTSKSGMNAEIEVEGSV